MTKRKMIFRTSTERLWAICWGRKEIKIIIFGLSCQILESKIGNSFNQFSNLWSPLDAFFYCRFQGFGRCLLINSYSKNLAKYINAYVKGKSKKSFTTSVCILVEKKKGQGHHRLLSRFQSLHECKHTYVDAFGLTKKIILQVYYDLPQPRLLNSILTNGLTM